MSPRRAARNLLYVAVAALPLAAADAARAGQTKLEALYVASFGGIQVGRGAWVVDIVDDQYSAAANGRTTGLLQVFSSGHGTAAGRGTLAKPVTSNYSATVVSDKKSDEIRMSVSAGNVKEFSAQPAWPPVPDRVPVMDAHRHGIIDPMSAWLMPVAGNADPMRPEACQRTLSVFVRPGQLDENALPDDAKPVLANGSKAWSVPSDGMEVIFLQRPGVVVVIVGPEQDEAASDMASTAPRADGDDSILDHLRGAGEGLLETFGFQG